MGFAIFVQRILRERDRALVVQARERIAQAAGTERADGACLRETEAAIHPSLAACLSESGSLLERVHSCAQ